MSFLFPGFLIGALAVGIPLYLHLARRRNRAAIPWSSLRFLQPAPPRLEGRKRVEQWALLLLRCLAVVLLAVTFARPLLRRPLPGVPAAQGARVVLLIDTSASMQRAGLWAAARARAETIVGGLQPTDRLAILAFSDRASSVLGFDAWAAAPAADRRGLAEARLAGLMAGWGETDLGAALVAAADAIGDDASAGIAVAEQRVVLVSDLTEGARLTALTAAEWPADLQLQIERVQTTAAINLGLQAVPMSSDAQTERLQVRVTAHPAETGAAAEAVRATVRWSDDPQAATDVMVPVGESRVIPVPARSATPAALLLEGDTEGFDNRLFLVPPVAAPVRIVYYGADAADDPTGSRYFLERAFVTTRTHAPRVEAARASEARPVALRGADLIVLTESPGTAAEALRGYVEGGGTLLFAPRDAGAAEGLAALVGSAPLSVRESAAGREAVLTAVALEHPVLAPFADGRAGDFSNIRFWRHRVLDTSALPPAQVVARFDDGSPAWLVLPRGRGRVFVMMAGWNTGDSQLGLSSKLVPLLWSLLGADAAPALAVTVGQPLAIANVGTAEAGAFAVLRPDGRKDAAPADARVYAATDLPGLYEVTRGAARTWFAVNVAPAESVVAALPEEQLARVGGGAPARGTEGTALRAASAKSARETSFFRELEAQQRPWRHVLLAVLVALLIEGLLTIRRTRAAAPGGEAT